MMDLTLRGETWLKLTKQERRCKILQLEQLVKNAEPEHGVKIEPQHIHCDGIYARHGLIPKGTTLVGEIHLKPQINVVSQGIIRVATEDGVKTIVAPAIFISPAGTKRVGYAIEDTVWTVFHATAETDKDKIRAEFIAPNYETLDKYLESDNVGSSGSSSDKRSNNSNIGKESGKEGQETS